MNFLLILSGFILLIFGGNWLLKSAVSISLRLQIPKIIIGMTVVSFATSAPELIVSVKAALNGSPDLALGNVVGSNIANLALVLGITLLIAKIDVQKSFHTINWPVMMIASLLLYFFLLNDYLISTIEGIFLVSFLVIFLIYLLKLQKQVVEQDMSEDIVSLSKPKTIAFLFIGSIGLWGGSELLINGATNMALDFGVSERLIGITVVSIGTSIPELATSMIAIYNKEKGISLGNLLGSNIFNVFAVLGITSIVSPLVVSDMNIINFDIYVMLFFSAIIFPLIFFPKKYLLGRTKGFIILSFYSVYIYNIFI